jgi:hypothetical protein
VQVTVPAEEVQIGAAKTRMLNGITGIGGENW